jgi:hypothetical protein
MLLPSPFAFPLPLSLVPVSVVLIVFRARVIVVLDRGLSAYAIVLTPSPLLIKAVKLS